MICCGITYTKHKAAIVILLPFGRRFDFQRE